MNRFYIPHYNSEADHLKLSSKDELHHLRNVLRMKQGDPLVIFNGEGSESSGELIELTTHYAYIKILSSRTIEISKPRLILACAIPKKGKFELIIEKCTELGVQEIYPLLTERTEIVLSPERAEKKQQRYQTVAINAAKQSRRTTIPIIHPLQKFPTVLDQLITTTTVLIPSLMGDCIPVFEAAKKAEKAAAISFFIGPEGDFSPTEYQTAHEKGCIPITLGDTILKVETAALCILSCARQYFHCR